LTSNECEFVSRFASTVGVAPTPVRVISRQQVGVVGRVEKIFHIFANVLGGDPDSILRG
jgi:hypothetical protein